VLCCTAFEGRQCEDAQCSTQHHLSILEEQHALLQWQTEQSLSAGLGAQINGVFPRWLQLHPSTSHKLLPNQFFLLASLTLGLATWNDAAGSHVEAGEEQAAALRGLHVETAPENDSQGFLRIGDNVNH